jgi:hypothetical protein
MPDCPLYRYYDPSDRPHNITTRDITYELRRAAGLVHHLTHIPPARIQAYSLRSGGATALLVSAPSAGGSPMPSSSISALNLAASLPATPVPCSATANTPSPRPLTTPTGTSFPWKRLPPWPPRCKPPRRPISHPNFGYASPTLSSPRGDQHGLHGYGTGTAS